MVRTKYVNIDLAEIVLLQKDPTYDTNSILGKLIPYEWCRTWSDYAAGLNYWTDTNRRYNRPTELGILPNLQVLGSCCGLHNEEHFPKNCDSLTKINPTTKMLPTSIKKREYEILLHHKYNTSAKLPNNAMVWIDIYLEPSKVYLSTYELSSSLQNTWSPFYLSKAY